MRRRSLAAGTAAVCLFVLAPAHAVTINYPKTETIPVSQAGGKDMSPDSSVQFTARAGKQAGTFNGSIAVQDISGYQGTSSSITQGAFSYLFTFTLPSNGLGSGSVSTVTNALLSASDIDFTNIVFDGKTVQITKDAVAGSGDNITFTDSAGLKNVAIASDQLNSLLVQGIVNGGADADGSFSGNLSFRPVVSAAPEAGTWGMMVLGFGIAGTGLRKRRQNQSLSFA